MRAIKGYEHQPLFAHSWHPSLFAHNLSPLSDWIAAAVVLSSRTDLKGKVIHTVSLFRVSPWNVCKDEFKKIRIITNSEQSKNFHQKKIE